MSEDHLTNNSSRKEEEANERRNEGWRRRRWPGAGSNSRRTMGRRVLGLWLIALVALLGMKGPDTPTGAVVPRIRMPLITSGYANGFPWAFVGLNLSGNDRYDGAVVNGITKWNSLHWGAFCMDPFDKTLSKVGLQRRIPVIWGKSEFADRGLMDQLFNGACNDGRPLLFLNEPDMGDESSISPDTAADMFYTMTRGSWPRKRWYGPIYGGGVIIDHGYWVDQFIDSFARRYNGGSRVIPEIKGWHLHMYANWGGFGGDPPLSALTEQALDIAVEHERGLIASFIGQRRAEGNARNVYLDETGLLIRLNASVTDGSPTQYSERMASLLRKQDAMLRTFRPQVEGYEWFGVYASDPYCASNCAWLGFSGSNMVYPDGSLTPVGVAWRELAMQQ